MTLDEALTQWKALCLAKFAEAKDFDERVHFDEIMTHGQNYIACNKHQIQAAFDEAVAGLNASPSYAIYPKRSGE
jgi:hypothetical protein